MRIIGQWDLEMMISYIKKTIEEQEKSNSEHEVRTYFYKDEETLKKELEADMIYYVMPLEKALKECRRQIRCHGYAVLHHKSYYGIGHS